MKPDISITMSLAMGLLIPWTEIDTQDEAGKQSTAIPIAADTTGRLKEAWVGQVTVGAMTSVMQFRIVVQAGGDTVAYFDSVTEGRTGFPATWSVVGDTLAFDVARIRLTYRGTLNDAGDMAEGTWTQGGRALPLTLKRQAQEYTTANIWANRPQRPVGPFPYDSEEVTFENQADSVTLAGTLTLPRGTGRHPAVVLISGSGPQDRDQSLMEHKPFLVLADYFTRRGIAVLRYDDRGTAKSTGRFGPATSEDFARDAGAAVAFLGRHPRINTKEIGLVGHSEGGLIAPMVAGARNDVAFLVLMAGPGVDGATILLSQAETTLRANGAGESDIQRVTTLNRAAFEAAMRNLPEPEFMAHVEPTIQEVTRDLPEADPRGDGRRDAAGNAECRCASHASLDPLLHGLRSPTCLAPAATSGAGDHRHEGHPGTRSAERARHPPGADRGRQQGLRDRRTRGPESPVPDEPDRLDE